MSTNWQSKDSWPVSQTVLSWIILILFVVLVSDWSFVRERIKESIKEAEAAIVSGTQEYDDLMSEMTEIIISVKRASKDGTLTLDQGAEAQMGLIVKGSKIMPKMKSYGTAEVYHITRDHFIASWKPSSEFSEDALEFFRKYPARKEQHVGFLFDDEWRLAQDRARMLFPETRPVEITGEKVFGMLQWVLRWYWLLTIPSLVIFLLNRKYRGESAVAELLLQPRRLILACLAGPFGLVAISETAANAWRYRKLRDEFYAKYQRGPDEQEEQAIRRRVVEPLLEFEQALEMVRSSGERIRRPLMVCVLAWIIGVMNQPIARQLFPLAVVQETILSTNDAEEVKNVSDEDTFNSKLLLTILPVAVDWWIETVKGELIVKEDVPRDVLWEAVLARGPPPVAKEQSLLMNNIVLGCTTQKG